MNETDFERLLDNEHLTTPVLAMPPPVSLLKLRRELKQFVQAQIPVTEGLTTLRDGKYPLIGSGAYSAIAVVKADLRYPVEDEDNPIYQRALLCAQKGELMYLIDDATDEVASVVRIVAIALDGLQILDTLGSPLPARWSNLPAAILARAINNHCVSVIGPAAIR